MRMANIASSYLPASTQNSDTPSQAASGTTPVGAKPAGPLRVTLRAAFNPDFGSYSHNGGRPPNEEVTVTSLREARAACIEYRDAHNLGGGHWGGGQVRDASGTQVAHISYNGRVWPPEAWTKNTPEIIIDLDGQPI